MKKKLQNPVSETTQAFFFGGIPRILIKGEQSEI